MLSLFLNQFFFYTFDRSTHQYGWKFSYAVYSEAIKKSVLPVGIEDIFHHTVPKFCSKFDTLGHHKNIVIVEIEI